MAQKRISRGRPPHQTPAARARRANVDPVIRALLAWRRQYCLSQVAAAEFARAHGFPLTASSIRMWERAGAGQGLTPARFYALF